MPRKRIKITLTYAHSTTKRYYHLNDQLENQVGFSQKLITNCVCKAKITHNLPLPPLLLQTVKTRKKGTPNIKVADVPYAIIPLFHTKSIHASNQK